MGSRTAALSLISAQLGPQFPNTPPPTGGAVVFSVSYDLLPQDSSRIG